MTFEPRKASEQMEQLGLFDVIKVPLTMGYFALIDPCDADLLALEWRAEKGKDKNVPYAVRSKNTAGIKCRLHRVILERKLGRKLLRTEIVDHIDGDGLNNRRSNLRLASPSQNSQNAPRRRDNKSGYKGVHFHKQTQRWRAKIDVNGKACFLGTFLTPEEAYTAYCRAAVELHGEFARL